MGTEKNKLEKNENQSLLQGGGELDEEDLDSFGGFGLCGLFRYAVRLQSGEGHGAADGRPPDVSDDHAEDMGDSGDQRPTGSDGYGRRGKHEQAQGILDCRFDQGGHDAGFDAGQRRLPRDDKRENNRAAREKEKITCLGIAFVLLKPVSLPPAGTQAFFVPEDHLNRLISNLIKGIRKRMISAMATHLKNDDFARGNS
jgi:hypothetical protein